MVSNCEEGYRSALRERSQLCIDLFLFVTIAPGKYHWSQFTATLLTTTSIKEREDSQMTERRIVVNDRMQSGYVYHCTEPMGENFHPDFQPELSPQEMLELGVFGGKYMTDCRDEFPEEWFSDAKLCAEKHDPDLNWFGTNASQSLSVWKSKGWINPDDPRGWFQWYCRYFMGRRCDDDERQIKRWRNMRRHVSQIRKNCEQCDYSCRARQRQAVLHWAYDSRQY